MPHKAKSDRSYEKWLKDNVVELALHHKSTCEDSECNISLIAVAEVIRRAGLELTDEERRGLM